MSKIEILGQLSGVEVIASGSSIRDLGWLEETPRQRALAEAQGKRACSPS